MSGTNGIYQLALDYTGEAYRFGYAGLTSKPEAAAPVSRGVEYHNVYANYDYGRGKLYLSYSRSNNVTNNTRGNTAGTILSNIGTPTNSYPGTDRNADRFYDIFQVSVDYRVTATTRIGALYGQIVDRTGQHAGASGGSIGGFHEEIGRAHV